VQLMTKVMKPPSRVPVLTMSAKNLHVQALSALAVSYTRCIWYKMFPGEGAKARSRDTSGHKSRSASDFGNQMTITTIRAGPTLLTLHEPSLEREIMSGKDRGRGHPSTKPHTVA
jgi:hypothetical protein